ncbi:MAG: hypothetical protein HKL98_01590 [Burkholderiales bacterium]|nr:hypothetical protein [Burkholderiales bacterium]
MESISRIPHMENSLIRQKQEREPMHKKNREKRKEQESDDQEPEIVHTIDTTA